MFIEIRQRGNYRRGRKMASKTIMLLICFVSLAVLRSECVDIFTTPQLQYDEVESNCSGTGASTLIPYHVIKHTNISRLLAAFEVNESAWIGGEKYNLGCGNATDSERVCTHVSYERIPEYQKKNFSCVKNGSGNEVEFLQHSIDVDDYVNSTKTCLDLGGRLPDLTTTHPLYKLPKEIQDPQRGPQWFEKFDNVLHNRVIKRCRFLTKVNECSFSISFGDCDDERKGVCYKDATTDLHDTIRFDNFNENYFIESMIVKEVKDPDLCDGPTTVEEEHSTERDELTTTVFETGILQDHSTELTHIEITTKTDSQTTTTELKTETTSNPEAEPSVAPQETSTASTDLWFIPVILAIIVMVIAVFFIIKLRQKRRFCISAGSEKAKQTSMQDINDPVEGSLIRRQIDPGQTQSSNSEITILGRGSDHIFLSKHIEITELDNPKDQQETEDIQESGIVRISVKSESEKNLIVVSCDPNTDEKVKENGIVKELENESDNNEDHEPGDISEQLNNTKSERQEQVTETGQIDNMGSEEVIKDQIDKGSEEVIKDQTDKIGPEHEENVKKAINDRLNNTDSTDLIDN